jgi:hypothetical protein
VDHDGGTSLAEVFSGVDSHLIKSFNAYDATFSGGVYVAAGNLNNDGFAGIFTGAGAGVVRTPECSTARRAVFWRTSSRSPV